MHILLDKFSMIINFQRCDNRGNGDSWSKSVAWQVTIMCKAKTHRLYYFGKYIYVFFTYNIYYLIFVAEQGSKE